MSQVTCRGRRQRLRLALGCRFSTAGERLIHLLVERSTGTVPQKTNIMREGSRIKVHPQQSIFSS